MPRYYPAMLNLRDRPVLVIGGNEVAAEKATALAASGARVTVQAAEFGLLLLRLAQEGRVTLRHKAYAYGDTAGMFVVVAATTYTPEVSQAIWQEAQERGQMINIVDDPARCDFIIPSILRRGSLTIAVSTEGTNPSLAKRIRQRLESLFPPAYAPYLRMAGRARSHLRAQGVDYGRRDAFFGELEASAVLSHLVDDDVSGAAQIMEALLTHYETQVPASDLAEAVTNDGDL